MIRTEEEGPADLCRSLIGFGWMIRSRATHKEMKKEFIQAPPHLYVAAEESMYACMSQRKSEKTQLNLLHRHKVAISLEIGLK